MMSKKFAIKLYSVKCVCVWGGGVGSDAAGTPSTQMVGTRQGNNTEVKCLLSDLGVSDGKRKKVGYHLKDQESFREGGGN